MQQATIPVGADTAERLRRDFSHTDFPTALAMLTDSGIRGRVARCVTVSSNGSLENMKEAIRFAKIDKLGAMAAGESFGAFECVRDLSVSYLIDSPLDFWICHVARLLHGTKYYLVTLTSVEVAEKPILSSYDATGEGVATFRGTSGTITIIKENLRWHAFSDHLDFKKHGLDVGWIDETAFRTRIRHFLRGWLRPS